MARWWFFLVLLNSSSFSATRLSISCFTWPSSSWARSTLFSSCSRVPSASSSAPCSSSFSCSRRRLCPPVYSYQYGVNDDYSGANFQQSENRDGYSTSGIYTVALPDGRVQTVKYTDNGDGVIQDVTYEGVPQYGPTVVKTAVVAHPVAHAIAHPVAVAHPVAHAIAHPVAVAHPVAHAVVHPVFHG